MTGEQAPARLSHASDMASIRACVEAQCLLVPEQATTLLADRDRLATALDELAEEVVRFQDDGTAYATGYQRADDAARAAIEQIRAERTTAREALGDAVYHLGQHHGCLHVTENPAMQAFYRRAFGGDLSDAFKAFRTHGRRSAQEIAAAEVREIRDALRERLYAVGPGYHGLAIHPRVGDSGAFEDCQQQVCIWVRDALRAAGAAGGEGAG